MRRLLLIAVLTGLYLIISTSYSFFLLSDYNFKRLAEGILLIGGVGVICSSKIMQQKWLEILTEIKDANRLLLISIIFFFILGVLSSILASYSKFAFLEVVQFFLLFNLMVVFIIAYQNKRSYFEIGFLTVIGFMAGLYLLNIIVNHLYSFFIPGFPMWPGIKFLGAKMGDYILFIEPFLNFANVRFFNHLQTWSLPLLTLLVLRIPKKYWAFSKIAFMITCGWWMLVFAAGARGSTLASFIALGFIFIMYQKKAQSWLRTHSLAAVTGFSLYLVFFKLLQSGERIVLTRYTANGRFELWEYAFQLLLQNPFLGAGPMHYAVLNPNIIPSAPHNAYFQIFSEWGIPAGILFLVIVALGSYKWFIRSDHVIKSSSANSKKVNIRVALTASLLASLIHAFFTNNLNTPSSQIMMVLVLAWMIGISLAENKEEGSKQVSSYLRYGLTSINLLAAGFLIWFLVSDFPKLYERRQHFIEITNGDKLAPRYWEQGKIGIETKKGETMRVVGSRDAVK